MTATALCGFRPSLLNSLTTVKSSALPGGRSTRATQAVMLSCCHIER
jgi:hypothetical protein